MAYSINGKVYTDHALMDEIVYNTKIIIQQVVLKNDNTANENETDTSLSLSDYYIDIMNDNLDLNTFPLSKEMLIGYGYTNLQATTYIEDRTLIPVEDQEKLLVFCKKYFLDNYEEQNNYYRMLTGLPEYNTTEYNAYLDPNEELLLDDDANTDFVFSKPIHEYPISHINTLETLGIISKLISTHPGKHYEYLRFLGGKSIDIYTARCAGNWDILYIPSVEYLVRERFKELFKINRDIYYQKTYQDAYRFESDYYDEIMMVIILCQTFTDMIVDIPEWYIRRDIFDLRTAQYFLESQGVKFFKEIPLKYQIRIVKGLNKLIRYKSTTRNINDIMDMFAIDDATVYKFFLYKDYVKTVHTQTIITTPPTWHMENEYDFGDEEDYEGIRDMTSAEIFDFLNEDVSDFNHDEECNVYDFISEDADIAPTSDETDKKQDDDESKKEIVDSYGNVYNLKFVKVPVGENYDDYIKDELYKSSYDNITYQDKYWDGEDTHYFVHNKHLEQDFTIQGTKYMTADIKISMSEYLKQMSYFLGMIFSSKVSTDAIKFNVPSLDPSASFSIQELFMFVFCCSGLYDNKTIQINNPKNLRIGKKPDHKYYEELDGGHPWNGGQVIPPEPEPEPKPWEMEDDYDFGDEETEDFVLDQYTQVFDFGYNYTINPNEECNVYDFEDIDNPIIIPPIPVEPPEPVVPPVYPWDNLEKGVYDIDLNGNIVDIDPDYRQNYDGGVVQFSMINSESYYDWLRSKYPWMYVDLSGRINGFNMNADLDKLAENIGVRHSAFGFKRGYTLEELKVDKFITFKSIITSDDIVKIYNNNIECYNNLKELINAASSRDEKIVLKYVYDTLFTVPFDYDFYTLKSGDTAVTYDQLLSEKDYTLYKEYKSIANETDIEVRKDNIRNILNDIVGVLEYYLASNKLNYAYSFASTHSFGSLVNYLTLIVNFFKSWKVYFLDPTITYVLDDKVENSVILGDSIAEMKIITWKRENSVLCDTVQLLIKHEFVDKNASGVEIVGAAAHYVPDGILKDDYDGLFPSSDQLYGSNYEDLDGGLVEAIESSPYVNYDSGWIAARIDMEDMNGGFPSSESYDCIDIDGLNCTDQYSLYPKNINGWEDVGFDVDGGGVSDNFYSPTMVVNFNGGNINSEVRISRYTDNLIKTESDGLYVGDIFAELKALSNLKISMKYDQFRYTNELESYITEVKAYGSEEAMNQTVDNYYAGLFEKAATVLDLYHKNNLSKSMTDYTDARVTELSNWYEDLNPLGWKYF